MYDISLPFKGIGYNDRSSGTNFMLQYFIDCNLEIPTWLEPNMSDWPRFIKSSGDGLLHGLYNSAVRVHSPLERFKLSEDYGTIFSRQILFIMNELEGGWAYMVGGKYDQNFAFELELEAMAFKLRWL